MKKIKEKLIIAGFLVVFAAQGTIYYKQNKKIQELEGLQAIHTESLSRLDRKVRLHSKVIVTMIEHLETTVDRLENLEKRAK